MLTESYAPVAATLNVAHSWNTADTVTRSHSESTSQENALIYPLPIHYLTQIFSNSSPSSGHRKLTIQESPQMTLHPILFPTPAGPYNETQADTDPDTDTYRTYTDTDG